MRCGRTRNGVMAQKDWIFLKKKCQEYLLKRKIVVPLHSQHGQKLIYEWMSELKGIAEFSLPVRAEEFILMPSAAENLAVSKKLRK